MKTNLFRYIILFCLIFSSCDKNDYNRIPTTPVHISIDAARWNIYGVHAFPDHRNFIKSQQVPTGFQYSVSSSTGFGGVLLLSNYEGQPLAFDLSCPVESRANVRIEVDVDKLYAKCPVCGSTYEIFNGSGSPLSGEARKRKYFLRKYVVYGSPTSGSYVISN
ncbi:hypothetical protein [Coprobacter tertius]|uniref:Rieske domain-containing protein n=1 Tax=Coprobacter tertius TaxID=2944915 RepID=A0ABT1MDZ1_9BACT|nr:hypothetical protein [Coprobacter tertius]MCP9610848.1 hypothetical protein [Coprobacter tertius]